MSEIKLTSVHELRRGGVATRRSSRTRLNNGLMLALLAVVALSPLPLGSNRPLAWAFIAMTVGICGVAYAMALASRVEAFRIGLKAVRLQAILFGLLAAYIFVQTLPLAGWLPSSLHENLPLSPRSISLAPGATWLMLLRMLTYGLFFLLVLQVASNDRRREVCLDVLLAITTFYAVLGIVALRLGDTLLGLEKWAYLGSATGPFVNRNSFATFLAFGAVIAVAQLMNLIDEWQRRVQEDRTARDLVQNLLIYAVSLTLIMAAIILTQSRMGLLVTLCGGVAVAMAGLLRGHRVGLVPLLIGLLIVVVGTVTFTMFGEGLLERLGSLERASEDRAALYAQVLAMIGTRPWTGFGGGAFELAFPLVHQPPVSVDVVWDKAHSTYLALWAELGFVAGSIPILLVLLTFIALLCGLFARRGDWVALAVGIGVICVGGLHSLVDFSLEIQSVTLFFLTLCAIGMASVLRIANSHRTSSL